MILVLQNLMEDTVVSEDTRRRTSSTLHEEAGAWKNTRSHIKSRLDFIDLTNKKQGFPIRYRVLNSIDGKALHLQLHVHGTPCIRIKNLWAKECTPKSVGGKGLCSWTMHLSLDGPLCI